MQSLFTSDLHIGHNNIHNYRKPFSTAEEHHEFMISKIEALTKRQMLIIIGDFLFDCDKYDEYLERILKCRCQIKLVMGNHDSKKLYQSGLDIQLPLYSYKNFWVSHAPIHEQELRNRYGNIHGHLHLEHVTKQERVGDFNPTFKEVKDERYFNVNIDVNDYEFVKFDVIREKFKDRK